VGKFSMQESFQDPIPMIMHRMARKPQTTPASL